MPSDLPVVTPDPPPRSRAASEKYGSLYYVGIAGLAVVVGLVVWFGVGLWSLRGVFHEIYILHDSRRSDAERINAAYRLTRDPHFTPAQAWDIALRKDVPPLARYLIAEAWTPALVMENPRRYTLAAMRSREWPGWLRTLALRPIAYAADDGVALPSEALQELPRDDSSAGLWGRYILAARAAGTAEAAPDPQLASFAATPGPVAPLASSLQQALRSSGHQRDAWLDRATLQTRGSDPECQAVWKGWALREGQIVAAPAR